MKRNQLDQVIQVLETRIRTLMDVVEELRERQGKAPARRPAAVKPMKTAAPNAHD